MICCALAVEAAALLESGAREEIQLASIDLGEGLRQTELSVPTVHCAGCIAAIERAFANVEGVEQARLNLSTRRLTLKWRGDLPPPMFPILSRLGYEAVLFDPNNDPHDAELKRLMRATAFAGFAAMNIMLLSVSVWSGADADTRQAFHWISAGLALPVLAYSGRIFYQSAWSALRQGRTNMDVPISIGVALAFTLSLYDTVGHGAHAYFDAASSLILFLLIGRTFDYLMRSKARSAVLGLGRMMPRGAVVVDGDGGQEFLAASDIRPGMRLIVRPGDRIVVDCVVESGSSEVDCSVATGESAPQPVTAGAKLRAGALNLTGALTIVAVCDAKNSFVAEMTRLMEIAESGRIRYRRIADRAARLYSPVIHLAALLTFTTWFYATGDAHQAASTAVAVLIITCPCALGLAAPMVQTIAARRLFDAGVLVKDGAAMERLAEIDAVAFDKTGTLTLGRPRLKTITAMEEGALAIAGVMAGRSSHPVAAAIADLHPIASRQTGEIKEFPGYGVEMKLDGSVYRLGRSVWACGGNDANTVLSRDGAPIACFEHEDEIRPDAKAALDELRAIGLAGSILSGDIEANVASTAQQLGIDVFAAELLPQDKMGKLEELAGQGRKVLMVGDGLNDAPALLAAHVSMAPSTAADIGRNAADFVFLHGALAAVPQAISLCRQADRMVRQNFSLSIIYNAIALPIAVAGFVTPLIAALAMSLSSILVVANALHLKPVYKGHRAAAPNKQHFVAALQT